MLNRHRRRDNKVGCKSATTFDRTYFIASDLHCYHPSSKNRTMRCRAAHPFVSDAVDHKATLLASRACDLIDDAKDLASRVDAGEFLRHGEGSLAMARLVEDGPDSLVQRLRGRLVGFEVDANSRP